MDRPTLAYFRDPPLDGATNMARDEHLLHSPIRRPASLRIYQWTPPTLSLGYFQQYGDIATLPEPLRGLSVVRRATGGGAILHDREITYALILDDSISAARRGPAELYRAVHECWREVLAGDGIATELAPENFPLPTPRTGPFFCFEKPGRTDLLIRGRKVLGSAQRRIPGRVMQHGSLILGRGAVAQPGADLGDPPSNVVDRWIGAFAAALADSFGLTLVPATWRADELADVAARSAVHASDEWLRRR